MGDVELNALKSNVARHMTINSLVHLLSTNYYNTKMQLLTNLAVVFSQLKTSPTSYVISVISFSCDPWQLELILFVCSFCHALEDRPPEVTYIGDSFMISRVILLYLSQNANKKLLQEYSQEFSREFPTAMGLGSH